MIRNRQRKTVFRENETEDRDFWSEWLESNQRNLHPKCSALPLGHTPKYEILIFDRRFSCGRRYGLSCGRAESPEMRTSHFRAFSRLLNNFCEAIVGFPGLCGNGREYSYTLPNQALYQLSYTPVTLTLYVTKRFLSSFIHASLWTFFSNIHLSYV